MFPFLAALVAAAALVAVSIRELRPYAFRRGWFERSNETDLSRDERRPTHAGLCAAGAFAVVGLAGAFVDKATLAIAVPGLVCVLIRAYVRRSRYEERVFLGATALCALLVPFFDARPELTGQAAVDHVLTAVAIAVVIVGLRNIERVEGTAPSVAVMAALACGSVAVAVGTSGPEIAAGAVLGALAAIVVQAMPPGLVRVGSIGHVAIGSALCASLIILRPPVAAPTSALVPLLALGVPALAALVPSIGGRLTRRHLPAGGLLIGAAALGSVAAFMVGTDRLAPAAACAVALVPLVGLAALCVGAGRDAHRAPSAARRVVFAVGVLAVVGIGSLAARSLLDARRHLEHGRTLAEQGLDAARHADVAQATALFHAADADFASASDALGKPWTRLSLTIPFVARNVRVADTVTDVGTSLTDAALTVTSDADTDALKVEGGRLPVAQMGTAGQSLTAALGVLDDAVARLDDVASPYVVPSVRDAASGLSTRLTDTEGDARDAAEALALAPDLFGANGPKRYFLAIVSPSELRGSGGILGSYAELAVDDGHITVPVSGSDGDLNTATDPAKQGPALPAIYRERYGGNHADSLWQNLTAPPSFPTVASAIKAAYPLTAGGSPVDGVIQIDPFGLAAMLQLSGPVTVPGWPVPITADNAAQVLLFDSYDQLHDQVREDFQSAVVRAVVDALTTRNLPGVADIARALGPVAAGGHIRVAAVPGADALLRRTGLDGQLPADGGGDVAMLVTQNGSESKVDWYLHRTLAYDVTYDPTTGITTADATITIRNDAPSKGVNTYVIGGSGLNPLHPGENRTYTSLFSPLSPTHVTDASGNEVQYGYAGEQGLVATTVLTTVPPGGTETFTIHLAGNLSTGNRYRLQLGHQPVVHDDTVTVTVHLPPVWEAIGPTTFSSALTTEDDLDVNASYKR